MKILVPITTNVRQRDTAWICVCPECQHERVVTYAQKWNLDKGNSSLKCRDCLMRLGELNMNIKGLELGRGYHERKNPRSTAKWTTYRNLFSPVSEFTREKQRNAKLGKMVGEKHYNWRGGITSENLRLRASDKYKQLRIAVFKRDSYTCQICFRVGKELNMDHIKEWSNYPELRFELTNCRTLCKPCHLKTDNYGTKAMKRAS